MQFPHVGRSSPHLMRRFRHVRQPVFVLFLILDIAGEAETPVCDTCSGPTERESEWTFAMVRGPTYEEGSESWLR